MSSLTAWVILGAIGLILLAVLGRYKFTTYQSSGYEEPFMSPFSMTETDDSHSPNGVDESTKGARAYSGDTEKLIASERLRPFSEQEAVNNWSRMTSEKCYKTDMGEQLKKTRNFLQRTNNYQHSHPDSCSAPNHEFVGTFYQPHEGVGATPKTGLPYPPSTLCE